MPRRLRRPGANSLRFSLYLTGPESTTINLAAKQRDISGSQLISLILAAAVSDKLIDAILDDGGKVWLPPSKALQPIAPRGASTPKRIWQTGDWR